MKMAVFFDAVWAGLDCPQVFEKTHAEKGARQLQTYYNKLKVTKTVFKAK